MRGRVKIDKIHRTFAPVQANNSVVRITIDNDDRQLQPELEGVAQIQTPQLRVYQKVSREFLK